jgi:hypothetical protein
VTERLAVFEQPPEFIAQRARLADAVRYAAASLALGVAG